MTKEQSLWLEELKTTQQGQCCGVMKDFKEGNARYCCLGLITELFGNLEEKAVITTHGHLSDRLTALMGLHGPLGEFAEPYGLNGINYRSLAVLNDQGFSFKEIASVVERNKEKVFV